MRHTMAMMLLTSIGCAHMSDPCTNYPLKRVNSPDGTLVLATYHRECRSIVLTMATVEKEGEVVCDLMSWGDQYAIEAEWNGNDAIAVRATDRVEKADVQGSNEACEGIKVSYSFQFRNEQQRTEDAAVIARMKGLLSELEPCIDRHYDSAGSPDSPARRMSGLIDRGEHRSAFQNLLSYINAAGCPLPPESYAALSELSSTFDLKPKYLEGVASLVRR